MTLTTPRGSLAGEHDAGRLDGDVGACADRDADVGACERRSVVHTVADHRHREATGLQVGDLGGLVLGEHLGHHLVDLELPAHRVSHLFGVPGDHDDVHAA